MPGDSKKPLQDGDLLAAIDLGSNSFHMVVARYVLGQLRIVDRIKETVRLAEGLNGTDAGLNPDVIIRATDCLSRFGQRLRTLPSHQVRAVATNTVRVLNKNAQSFLKPAEAALGHPIEVVSGREEARLIYLGVAHGQPPRDKRRLVMDIGGGSTEFIIGEGFEALERESLQMGCVATTKRFFSDGQLSKKRWKEAQTEISAEFQQFASVYRERGWQEVYGSSGTIKAIGEICAEMKMSSGVITEGGLRKICDELLKFDQLSDIHLPGLPNDRRPVIAGGLLILDAAFRELGISRMAVSDDALREGVLYDMIGRQSATDPRDASVNALCERYAVDMSQAQRVETSVIKLFKQVAEDWLLDEDEFRLLCWAARLHEMGLAIAHSQYHSHGAYLIEHSDVAGFSKTEQQFMAALIRNHRRGFHNKSIQALPERLSKPALRCVILLRLAVLLHRSHEGDSNAKPKLTVTGNELKLKFEKSWLKEHPLTQSDLEAEKEYLATLDYQLVLNS
jgi:exopolyphosphatase / guanosine-5'-triphosphate,3'-diphosphate pyrophosphatase